MRGMTFARALAALLALLPSAGASAHEMVLLRMEAVFDRDGGIAVTLHSDRDLALFTLPSEEARAERDALTLETIHRHLASAEPEAREQALGRLRAYVAKAVRIRAGGELVPVEVSFPDALDLATPVAPEPGAALLGARARLAGRLARGAGAEGVTFAVAPRFGSTLLSLRWQGEAAQAVQHLAPGAESAPFRLASSAAAAGSSAIFVSYLALGFEHILPRGADHILFVLGLFLLSAEVRALLWQVSAFTVAHSVTLALAIYGLVRIPAEVVEPLIALSIAFVALENLLTSELRPWRPFVVFGFGLVHGLGFAGVLSRLALPKGELLPALLAFNAGVELGQLTVIGMAFACVGWLRASPRYRHFVVIPGSTAIAAVGIVWAVQRSPLAAAIPLP